MTETIVFPDATLLVVNLISAELGTQFSDTATVGTRVPNPRGRFVLVRRVGGTSRSRVIDQAVLTVEAWGENEHAAQVLIQRCRALVHAAEGSTLDGVAVYRVSDVAGPALLPDPESTQPRFTCTLQVAVRGSAA